VPTGGLLVPTIGVGGHCLPKDGILLLWRMIEAGRDVSASLILQSRRINDESPGRAADRSSVCGGPRPGKRSFSWERPTGPTPKTPAIRRPWFWPRI
jgi:hypothetical protein